MLPPPTYIPLRPAGLRAPNFPVELDGSMHRVTVTWNVSAQRYYFNLYDALGIWLVSAPLIATAPGLRINGLVYDAPLRSMVVRLLEPHWRPLGQIVDWWIEGADPDSLNGLHRCETTGANEFIFYVGDNPFLDIDPGHIALAGTAHRYANLTKGYIKDSVLLFRGGAFEVR
jgi:hypothetical protein